MDNNINNESGVGNEQEQENMSPAAKRALARRMRIQQAGSERMGIITSSLEAPKQNEENEQKEETQLEEKPALSAAQIRAQKRREKIKQSANERFNILYSVSGIEPVNTPQHNSSKEAQHKEGHDDNNNNNLQNNNESEEMSKEVKKDGEGMEQIEEQMKTLVSSLLGVANNIGEGLAQNPLNNNNTVNNINNNLINNIVNNNNDNMENKAIKREVKRANKSNDKKRNGDTLPKINNNAVYFKSILFPLITMISAILYTLTLFSTHSPPSSPFLSQLYFFLHSYYFPSLILPTLLFFQFFFFIKSFFAPKKNTSSLPFSFLFSLLGNSAESNPLSNLFFNTILPAFSSLSLFNQLLLNLSRCLFVFVFTIVIISPFLS